MAEESDNDSVNSENDSDGEVAAMAVAEADAIIRESVAETRYLERGASTGDEAKVPETGVFYNKVTGTAHMVHSSLDGRSACGMVMKPLCYEYANEEYCLLGCSLCWRSGCASWVALEPFSEVVSENGYAYSPTDAGDIEDLDLGELVCPEA